MRLIFRRHALDQIADRGLDPVWVQRVALHPDWSAPDPQAGVMRHYGAVQEHGGRVLRVVAVDRDDARHVLTGHFDRGARRRKARDARQV